MIEQEIRDAFFVVFWKQCNISEEGFNFLGRWANCGLSLLWLALITELVLVGQPDLFLLLFQLNRNSSCWPRSAACMPESATLQALCNEQTHKADLSINRNSSWDFNFLTHLQSESKAARWAATEWHHSNSWRIVLTVQRPSISRDMSLWRGDPELPKTHASAWLYTRGRT